MFSTICCVPLVVVKEGIVRVFFMIEPVRPASPLGRVALGREDYPGDLLRLVDHLALLLMTASRSRRPDIACPLTADGKACK